MGMLDKKLPIDDTSIKEDKSLYFFYFHFYLNKQKQIYTIRQIQATWLIYKNAVTVNLNKN